MANENTKYEKLTQEIYQALNSSTELKTIDVQHNIRLEGKSGCKHQIDVYWEFEMMGELHKVAIECKNYSDKVSVGRIRDFYGVLDDIGNIKGIFVTKVGFQSGAKKYADTYGISLKEMRFPLDVDWAGRMKDMHLTISAYVVNIKDRKLNLDMNWILDNTSIKEGDKIEISGINNEIKIVDADGKEITNFYEIENNLDRSLEKKENIVHIESFDDAYILSPNNELLKINSVQYIYDILVHTQESVFEGESIARAILKDVSTGEIKFYNKYGIIK
jgi:hypothetical protein